MPDSDKISGVSVKKESVQTQNFVILALYLYIANVLKSEDACAIAKLNERSSMFPLQMEYGRKLFKVLGAWLQ